MVNLLKGTALAAVRAGASVPARRQLERVGRLVVLRRLLHALQIDCVLDVGANRGQFGRELRGVGYRGWIVSFEPNPNDFRILKAAADEKWLCYPLALSSENGERSFNIAPLSLLSSFLTPIDGTVEQRIPVNMRRLDGLLDDILARTGAHRLFLKMDTQGFDLEVVKGADARMGEFAGMLSELSVTPIYQGMPTYLDALQLYHSLGFKLHSLHVVSWNADGSVLEYDGFMVR